MKRKKKSNPNRAIVVYILFIIGIALSFIGTWAHSMTIEFIGGLLFVSTLLPVLVLFPDISAFLG
jgi:hypothetical protein